MLRSHAATAGRHGTSASAQSKLASSSAVGPGESGVLAECDGGGGVGGDGGGVDVEGDEAGADGGGAAGEEGADGDGEAELFGDFAGEGGGGGFAGFDFAAGEFPFAGEAAVRSALGDEALVALRDGGANNVEGRHGRECNCCGRAPLL